MPHAISDNQRRLMTEIRRRGGSASIRDLGGVRDAGGQALTSDVARKVLDRLAQRGFVSGEGRGRDRIWAVTDAGAAQLEQEGSAADRDWTRPYVVLERLTLEELLERGAIEGGVSLYVEVTVVPARNTEHAFKLAAAAYTEDHDTTMVAVATRNFQPEPVHITNSRSVSVG